MVGVAFVVILTLVGGFLTLVDEDALTSAFKSMGVYAPFCYVMLLTVSLAVGIPGNIIAIAGGAIFGLVWGTVLSLIGSTLGAIAAFCLARYLLHDWFIKRFGHYSLLQQLNQTLANYAFNVVLATRFTPLSPFSLVNFLFGLTPIHLKTYVWGTFLGLIPLSITYSWLGASGYQAMHGGDLLPLMLALSLLTLLSILPMLIRKPILPGALSNPGEASASKTASLRTKRRR